MPWHLSSCVCDRFAQALHTTPPLQPHMCTIAGSRYHNTSEFCRAALSTSTARSAPWVLWFLAASCDYSSVSRVTSPDMTIHVDVYELDRWEHGIARVYLNMLLHVYLGGAAPAPCTTCNFSAEAEPLTIALARATPFRSVAQLTNATWYGTTLSCVHPVSHSRRTFTKHDQKRTRQHTHQALSGCHITLPTNRPSTKTTQRLTWVSLGRRGMSSIFTHV